MPELGQCRLAVAAGDDIRLRGLRIGPVAIGGMLLGLGMVLIGALFVFRRRRTVAGH